MDIKGLFKNGNDCCDIYTRQETRKCFEFTFLDLLILLDDGGKKKGGRCMNTSGATTSFADSCVR